MSSTAQMESSVSVVCPDCHGELSRNPDSVVCLKCQTHYPILDGIADLIVGDRYDDDTPDCVLCNEEVTNQDTAIRYWHPLFQKLLKEKSRVRVLSLGCGVGADVDALVDQGWDAYGLDNGK